MLHCISTITYYKEDTAKINYNIESFFYISGTFPIYAVFGIIGIIYIFILPETEKNAISIFVLISPMLLSHMFVYNLSLISMIAL